MSCLGRAIYARGYGFGAYTRLPRTSPPCHPPKVIHPSKHAGLQLWDHHSMHDFLWLPLVSPPPPSLSTRVVYVCGCSFCPTSHPEWNQEGERMKALAVGIQEALSKNFLHIGGGERGRKTDGLDLAPPQHVPEHRLRRRLRAFLPRVRCCPARCCAPPDFGSFRTFLPPANPRLVVVG